MNGEGTIRVLLVGAAASVSERVGDALDAREEEFAVVTASDAETALEAVDGVDCVVTGLDIPGTERFEFLSAVRGECPELPYVFFAGREPAGVAGDALDAGADRYLQRGGPDQYSRLANAIATLAAGHRARREASLFETLLADVPLGVYVKDETGEHRRVSDAHLEQVRGAGLRDPAGEPIDSKADFIGKTDPEVFGYESVVESHEDDMAVIESGEPVLEKEEHHRIPDGDDVWVRTSKVPWRDEAGAVRGLLGVSIDTTAERQYERELERQNERLEKFASVVSHDLRNPLAVARGNLDLIETDDEDTRQRVADALDWMDDIVEDVLTLARQGRAVEETERVAVDAVAEECWAVVETGGASVETDAAAVEADPDRLRRLLGNLFRNAVEHGSTSSRPADDTAESGSTGAPSPAPEDGGGSVSVSVGPIAEGEGFYVADDGPGIPESERETVFERGYSTAEDGTGFGLAIVAEIAEAHGWHLDITESAAGGARFEFRT